MILDPFANLRCRVIDAHEARTVAEREVLLVIAQTFDTEGACILHEPSVVGGRSGPPDIAVVDPASGLHVIEVKGITLEQVRAVRPGGGLEIQYDTNVRRIDPSRQARNAMFDVKDAASRHFGGELNAAFESWVAFPRIRRGDWQDRFGDLVASRTDVLFLEDLESSTLGDRLRAEGRRRLRDLGGLPPRQMESLLAAFGDSAVLAPPDPPPGSAPEGSLGERLADAYADYRRLTVQQRRLANQGWDEGPRLVRGVAGSGKTVVLATQVARMLERAAHRTRGLLAEDETPRILAVCFNRTLVPFIRARIEAAYAQRNDGSLPAPLVEVVHFNGLMWRLAQEGRIQYQRVRDQPDPGARARCALADLDASGRTATDAPYHAIFVDEGQDFHEDEYRLLMRMCRVSADEQPRLFVFYDDAQNLYGRRRPTWSDLGLEIRGRSFVMDEAFRSTRQIVEPPFNVLLGSHADEPARVRTRGFADVATLAAKDLVHERGPHVAVRFAARQGDPVRFTRHPGPAAETQAVARRIEALLDTEGLRPHDVLVLTFHRERAAAVAGTLAGRLGPDRVRCASAPEEKDEAAVRTGAVTVSTIASAKGYDAPYVLLLSAEAFGDDVEGRASFYVGCTRAREWLEVSACADSPLVAEFERALEAMDAMAG